MISKSHLYSHKTHTHTMAFCLVDRFLSCSVSDPLLRNGTNQVVTFTAHVDNNVANERVCSFALGTIIIVNFIPFSLTLYLYLT